MEDTDSEAVAEEFRSLGLRVRRLQETPRKRVPDLLVRTDSLSLLVEVKRPERGMRADPKRPPTRGLARLIASAARQCDSVDPLRTRFRAVALLLPWPYDKLDVVEALDGSYRLESGPRISSVPSWSEGYWASLARLDFVIWKGPRGWHIRGERLIELPQLRAAFRRQSMG